MTKHPKWQTADSDWSAILESEFKVYMDACYLESLIDDEGLDVDFPEWEDDAVDSLTLVVPSSPVTATGYFFCGCRDCEVREYVAFLIPRIIKGYLDGKLKLEE